MLKRLEKLERSNTTNIAFKLFDMDKDGFITREEFAQVTLFKKYRLRAVIIFGQELFGLALFIKQCLGWNELDNKFGICLVGYGHR